MNSLHARLTLLLMIAVTAVAVLAAFVTYSIIDPPRRQSFDRAFAQEARLVSALLKGSVEEADRLGVKTGPAPATDTISQQQTAGINAALAGIGEAFGVVVATIDGDTYLGIPLKGDVWAYLPFPALPQSSIRPLTAYLTVVVLGSVAVAILAANKIVSPLRMLETAIASVGPDGEILHIDEKGPVEVRATARALNRLSSRLKTAMESRMRLVAAAGHDLRTPMTRMRLRAEFLPPEEQGTWLKDLEELDRIADSAIRLVREEVSDQKAEGGVPLGPLVAEIGQELRDLGLSVDWQAVPGLLVEGRPLALKRALRNLVDNAASHGGGARVAIRQDGEWAVIEIADDGPGIPEALLGRVFEPFFRVDPGRRKSRPGAGLGLAIAKEIIDQAGGTVRIENRPEGGLRQSVRLPVAPAQGSAAA
jgi:signal transduction histidine kinase